MNYVQEALDKMAELADLRSQIEVAHDRPHPEQPDPPRGEHFDWVHGRSPQIAQRRDDQRPAQLPPLQVIQVSTSGGSSRAAPGPTRPWPLAAGGRPAPPAPAWSWPCPPSADPDETIPPARPGACRLRAPAISGLPLDTPVHGDESSDLKPPLAQGLPPW